MDLRRRLNFHVVVDDGLLTWVEAANAAIARLDGGSSVLFRPGRPEFPHVTLIMGRVEDGFDVAGLWQGAAALTRRTGLPVLSFGPPYLAAGGHYVMADVAHAPALEAVRSLLQQELGCPEDETPSRPDRLGVSAKYDSAVHLTIAYVEGDGQGIRELLPELGTPPDLRVTRLGLSDAGEHGTCAGHLFTGPAGRGGGEDRSQEKYIDGMDPWAREYLDGLDNRSLSRLWGCYVVSHVDAQGIWRPVEAAECLSETLLGGDRELAWALAGVGTREGWGRDPRDTYPDGTRRQPPLNYGPFVAYHHGLRGLELDREALAEGRGLGLGWLARRP